MIEAAIFDVFGTVVDWRCGVAAELRRMLGPERPRLDFDRLADAWRAEYDPAMARIREGGRAYTALDILHRENLDRVLAAHGLTEALSEAAKAELNHAWEKLPPWPDSARGIAAIREQRLVAPCSNGSIALMSRLARFAGIEWDCILGAEIGRGYKPEPKVYLASCAALGLQPEQVVMVAAHNGDLGAAQSLGLKTAFIPRPKEHGPGQTKDLSPEGDWDFVAADLVDLAGKLDL